MSGGEEVDNFTYATGSTTVTNVRGQAVTYEYATVQGERKITAVSRAATSTCSNAQAITAYDANGYIDYTLDWNNNRTEYSYDSVGRLLRMTRMAGTSSAATTTYAWIEDDMVKKEYLDANDLVYGREEYQYHYSGRILQEKRTDLKTGTQQIRNYSYINYPNFNVATKTISEQLPAGISTTVVQYDIAGNVTSIANPPIKLKLGLAIMVWVILILISISMV